MSIYDVDPSGPLTLKFPQSARLLPTSGNEPSLEYAVSYREMHRVSWSSPYPISGIPVRKAPQYPSIWYFLGYRCEHCKTTFFGTELSDFVHDCAERLSERRFDWSQ